MDSAAAAAAFSLHQIGSTAQPGSPSEVVAAGSFSHQQQAQPAEQNHGSFSHVSVIPPHIMRTTPSIVVLSNTHQVVSLKLTTTNYLYWWMQMKSYLIGQGVFHFIDGLVSCPPSHVSNCSDGSSSAINPSFLHWKQHDQLILNALLSSLSMDVLHLVVDCQTSSCVWRTLEKTLASPLILTLCNFMGLFKIFGKEMFQLLHTCSTPSYYLMNWLLLASPSLLKTSTCICFMVFMVSLKTW